MPHFEYLHLYEPYVQKQIELHHFHDALSAIQHAVRITNLAKDNHGLVFYSQLLDHLCDLVAQAIQATIHLPLPQHDPEKGVILYFATALYATFGHTKMIEKLIHAFPEKQHHVFIADAPFHDPEGIRQKFAPYPNVRIVWMTGDNLLKKLLFCFDQVKSVPVERAYLFNHPDDALSIVMGMILAGCIPVYFYHHADATLALGVTCKKFKHIDLHPFSDAVCRDLHQDRLYWPLVHPLPPTLQKRGDRFHSAEGWVTASCGAEMKFTFPYPYSYLDLIPEIIKSTGGRHIHIGPLSPKRVAYVKKKLGDQADRFIHFPFVESLSHTLIQEKVDLYLLSFPIGGGLATIETLAVGVPILFHENAYSASSSSAYLSYEGSLSWRTPIELTDILKGLTPELLKLHAQKGLDYYEKCYNMPFERVIQQGSLAVPRILPTPSMVTDHMGYHVGWMAQRLSSFTLKRRGARLLEILQIARFWREVKKRIRKWVLRQ